MTIRFQPLIIYNDGHLYDVISSFLCTLENQCYYLVSLGNQMESRETSSQKMTTKSKVCQSTILSPTTEALPSHLTRQWPILNMWMKYAPTWVYDHDGLWNCSRLKYWITVEQRECTWYQTYRYLNTTIPEKLDQHCLPTSHCTTPEVSQLESLLLYDWLCTIREWENIHEYHRCRCLNKTVWNGM